MRTNLDDVLLIFDGCVVCVYKPKLDPDFNSYFVSGKIIQSQAVSVSATFIER